MRLLVYYFGRNRKLGFHLQERHIEYFSTEWFRHPTHNPPHSRQASHFLQGRMPTNRNIFPD